MKSGKMRESRVRAGRPSGSAMVKTKSVMRNQAENLEATESPEKESGSIAVLSEGGRIGRVSLGFVATEGMAVLKDSGFSSLLDLMVQDPLLFFGNQTVIDLERGEGFEDFSGNVVVALDKPGHETDKVGEIPNVNTIKEPVLESPIGGLGHGIGKVDIEKGHLLEDIDLGLGKKSIDQGVVVLGSTVNDEANLSKGLGRGRNFKIGIFEAGKRVISGGAKANMPSANVSGKVVGDEEDESPGVVEEANPGAVHVKDLIDETRPQPEFVFFVSGMRMETPEVEKSGMPVESSARDGRGFVSEHLGADRCEAPVGKERIGEVGFDGIHFSKKKLGGVGNAAKSAHGRGAGGIGEAEPVRKGLGADAEDFKNDFSGHMMGKALDTFDETRFFEEESFFEPSDTGYDAVVDGNESESRQGSGFQARERSGMRVRVETKIGGGMFTSPVVKVASGNQLSNIGGKNPEVFFDHNCCGVSMVGFRPHVRGLSADARCKNNGLWSGDIRKWDGILKLKPKRKIL